MSRKVSFAVLLLALSCGVVAAQTPTNTQDLRDWRTLGLPIAAEWNSNGFNFQYHVDQVRQGHRFLPSVKFSAQSVALNLPKPVENTLTLTDESWNFVRENSLPISLRTDNIAGAFAMPAYRLPIVASSIPPSPLVWVMVKGKTLKDSNLVDCLGPTSNWTNEGTLWGKSLYMQMLQARHPSPAYFVLVENNEGAYDALYRYSTAKETPASTWLPASQLVTLSVRMRDRVAQLQAINPGSRPYDFVPEFYTRRQAQYLALYSAFDAQLTSAWKGKMYTAAYRATDEAYLAEQPKFVDQLGYAPQLLSYDASSQSLYASKARLGDYTSLDQTKILNLIPAWEAARSRNPKAYRELLFNIGSGGVIAGKLIGQHEVMTPSRYEGSIQWHLWSIHDPGVPVILRRWCGASETPTTPLFETSDYKTLDAFGAGELKTATSETYLKPIISSVDRVCSDATLRDFWLRGTPVIVPGLGHPSKQIDPAITFPRAGDPDNRWRVLECSTNPPRASWTVVDRQIVQKLKVWAVATKLDDRILLYAWSPCNLTGNVTVTVPNFGTATIPVPQPWGYWILKAGLAPQKLSFP